MGCVQILGNKSHDGRSIDQIEVRQPITPVSNKIHKPKISNLNKKYSLKNLVNPTTSEVTTTFS